MFEQFLQYADKSISGERIKHMTEKIWRSDRWSKFSRFHQTAMMAQSAMRSAGLSNVNIMPLAADGRTRYGDYIIPQAWEARSGELRIVHPKRSARLLASYKQSSNSLMMYSASTPPSGMELEIVPWDDMRPLRRRQDSNCFGKLVFTGMYPASIWREAAKRGASGIVYANEKQDGIHWHNYCFVPRNEKKLFGFSLNREDGQWLKQVLRQAPRVIAHARVDANLFDGRAETVMGIVRGQSSDEMLAFAHLYEPGAWDNASGCASLLEISGILCRAIEKGLLPRPRRTIRFMLGWECYSLMAWLVQKKRPRPVAGLTMDGLGRDIIKNNAPLGIHGTPEANPAYTDAFLAAIAEAYLKDKGRIVENGLWKMFPFAAGDSLPSDPWFDVPMPYLYQPVRAIWHTSIDTADQLSAESLKWSAVIGATYLWSLANADGKDVAWIAGETARHYRERFVDFRGEVDGLQHLRDCGVKALDSVLKLTDGRERKRLIPLLKRLRSDLYAQYDLKKKRPNPPQNHTAPGRKTGRLKRLEKSAALMIPVRRVPGLLTLQTLPEDAKSNCRWGPDYHVLVKPILWADGKRSVLEIARAICFETGKVYDGKDLADLIDSFRFLDQHGYISFKRR